MVVGFVGEAGFGDIGSGKRDLLEEWLGGKG